MSLQQEYPSVLLERAVSAFEKLPGIGRKSALRMALFMLKQGKENADDFVEAVSNLCTNVHYCHVCHNISDNEICDICSNPQRDNTTICVVETIKEVMLIENTQQYKGLYHVLGGVISPMNGIGPSDLEISSLTERVAQGTAKEVIMALNPNMEGDTTSFYIYRKLADFDIKISTIARGISFGDELEYADEITLGRSILNRVDFKTN